MSQTEEKLEQIKTSEVEVREGTDCPPDSVINPKR